MWLYRGMSELELQSWERDDSIYVPAPKDFTTDHCNAIGIGRRHLLAGSLMVLCVDIEDHLLRCTISDRHLSWYQNTEPFNLFSQPHHIGKDY